MVKVVLLFLMLVALSANQNYNIVARWEEIGFNYGGPLFSAGRTRTGDDVFIVRMFLREFNSFTVSGMTFQVRPVHATMEGKVVTVRTYSAMEQVLVPPDGLAWNTPGVSGNEIVVGTTEIGDNIYIGRTIIEGTTFIGPMIRNQLHIVYNGSMLTILHYKMEDVLFGCILPNCTGFTPYQVKPPISDQHTPPTLVTKVPKITMITTDTLPPLVAENICYVSADEEICIKAGDDGDNDDNDNID